MTALQIFLLVGGACVVTAVLSAALSSIFTLLLARHLLERRWREEWQVRIDEQLARLRDDLGDTVRRRVREGVVEAVVSLPSTEVARGATGTAARTAAELLTGGLEVFLGGPRRRGRGEAGDAEGPDEADD